MKSVIKELWDGDISPQESGIFGTPQLKELLGYIGKHRAELEAKLTAEQIELLEKMMDYRNEFDDIAELHAFEYGFKLGARIVIEILAL